MGSHLPRNRVHPGHDQVADSMSGCLHSPRMRECRGSSLRALALQPRHLRQGSSPSSGMSSSFGPAPTDGNTVADGQFHRGNWPAFLHKARFSKQIPSTTREAISQVHSCSGWDFPPVRSACSCLPLHFKCSKGLISNGEEATSSVAFFASLPHAAR